MEPPTFTRRRLLAGAGATGFASITGLSVLTADARGFTHSTRITESSGVTLQSDWRATRNGETLSENGSAIATTDDGAAATVTNVLPGDSGTVSFKVTVDPDEDAADDVTVETSLWLDVTDTAENGYTEPEPETLEGGDVNDPGDPDGAGELQDHLQVEVWYDTGLFDVGGFGGENGVRDTGEGLVHPDAAGSFAAVADVLSEPGVQIGGCLSAGEDLVVTMGWEFPSSLPEQNATQGDSLTFDVTLDPSRCGGGPE